MSTDRSSDVLYFIPGTASLIMYSIQFVAVLLIIKCLRQTGFMRLLGLQRSDDQMTSSNQLVTTGLYSLVRHPLYLLSLIFMLFSPVVTVQWAILTIMTTLYFIYGALIEEKRLQVIFGEPYRQYQQSVPFMIPDFRRPKPHSKASQ